MRRALSLLLLLLLLCPTVLASEPANPPEPGARADDTEIVVYYFHGKRRCRTCNTIETLGRRTLLVGFEEQLEGGKVRWEPVNYELKENRHFIGRFQLVSSALVIAEYRGEELVRSKTLDQAWLLARQRLRFQRYVADELRAFLGEASAE